MIQEFTWQEFSADYTEILKSKGVSLTGATKSAEFLKEMPKDVKNSPEVLTLLLKQLDIWFTHTKKQKEFEKIYRTLNKKINSNLTRLDRLYILLTSKA
ncbi:MAG: hypothetical protein Q8L15_14210 [Methylobacter sp.]|nr:hypothetical protein [Methylobacter sp.]